MLAMSAAGVVARPAPAYARTQVAPQRGGVIVALDPDATADQAAAAVNAAGGELVHAVASTRTMLVRVPPGVSESAVASTLSALPGVRYAEPNGRVQAQAVIPNDPMYSLQWGLPAVNAPLAWDGARASSAVKVAVIDSGVYFAHPDLAGVLDSAHDYDFVNRDSDATDDNGHGTHVAGLVAAIANNKTGIASVGGFGPSTTGGVRILPFKVLDENGEGWDEDVALAIRRAADAGARVLNLSMGGRGGTSLSEAVVYARAKGCVIVAAAGNSGLDEVLYPAGSPGVIGVGSVDSRLRQAIFSNSGPHVDVCAPGEQVFSTEWPLAFGSGGELYGYMSGTSMATPFVAAEAALLFSAKPTATGPQVENAILASAKDLGPAGRDDDYGRGIIDVAKALSVLVGYDYTPPVTTAIGLSDRWAATDVTLTLPATDDLSGVASTYVRVGSATASAYSAPLRLTSEGETTLTFWSVDRAGNREADNIATVRIDKTPPRTSGDSLYRYVGAATIRLTPSDRLSGVASTRWSLDGVEGSGTVIETSEHGFHTLAFYSTDVAGNVEETQAVGFSVVNSASEQVPLTTTALGVPGGWRNRPATITLVSSGAGQAGSSVWYSLDGGTAIQYTRSFVVSKEGTTRLETWSSVDGQAEQHNMALVRIDTTLPELRIVGEKVYDDEASISASALDGGSGIDPDSMAWSLDGTTWTAGSVVTIPWPGRYAVRFKVSDVAGNTAQGTTTVVVTAASAITLAQPVVRTPVWGASVKLVGAVTPVPASPAIVTIEALAAGDDSWVPVQTVKTDLEGRFAANVKQRVRTAYRAVFAGDGVLRAASPTKGVVVTPKPWLSAVSGAPASARSGATLHLSGRVVPPHSSSVYLIVEKKSASGWIETTRRRLMLRADDHGGSAWSLARTLTRGTWRLRVYHVYDGLHATSYSGARYVRVR